MNTTTAITLLREIITTLPAAISTGQQVIDLVNKTWSELSNAGDDEELIRKIIANSKVIQQTK